MKHVVTKLWISGLAITLLCGLNGRPSVTDLLCASLLGGRGLAAAEDLPAVETQPPAQEAPEQAAVDKPAATDCTSIEWTSLFDGTTLGDWKSTEFGGEGEVAVEEGEIVLHRGAELTGIRWAGAELPKINYEVRLKARKIEGSDFFCGIVFPVADKSCIFVVGGWGGGVVGLSSVDGLYASDNETGSYQSFLKGQWYDIRLQVTEHRIRAWIDEKRLVNLKTAGRKIALHPSVQVSKPFGVCAFVTDAGLKGLEYRTLSAEEVQASEVVTDEEDLPADRKPQD